MARQFEVVPDEPEHHPPEREAAGTGLLLLALKALSQRAVAAIATLYSVLMVFSAWYLFLVTLPSPDMYQLIGLSLYGLLLVAVHLIVRK